jgi:hypothetical protein
MARQQRGKSSRDTAVTVAIIGTISAIIVALIGLAGELIKAPRNGVVSPSALPTNAITSVGSTLTNMPPTIPLAIPTPELEVSNITVTSHREYMVVKEGLQNGARVYIDREYVYDNIPSLLEGATYIKTAAEDKCLTDPASFYFFFTINRPSTIYITHDDKYSNKPTWMEGFERTDFFVRSTNQRDVNATYRLWKKHVFAGTIELGSNIPGTCQVLGNHGMYTVIIIPD